MKVFLAGHTGMDSRELAVIRTGAKRRLIAYTKPEERERVVRLWTGRDERPPK